MYKIFYALLTIIWVADIINLPIQAVDYLDTLIPINFLAWLLIWIFVPGTGQKITHAIECSCEEE